MRSLRLFPQWGFRSTLSPATGLRVEVSPPSLRHAPASAWQRLRFWLLAASPQDAAPPLNRLPGVRADFAAAVADVQGFDAHALSDRISLARSLRELWHLRAEVYRIVAVQFNQDEAELRLTGLNRHFPTRASRSAFALL